MWCIASNSRRFFSALLTLSLGAMSPTMAVTAGQRLRKQTPSRQAAESDAGRSYPLPGHVQWPALCTCTRQWAYDPLQKNSVTHRHAEGYLSRFIWLGASMAIMAMRYM